ncbi:MAG: hypothetical protein L0Y72_24665, partial [Gemmataceae bacterium]|nr:hypothetical protein [Gemmataceae bacterium]
MNALLLLANWQLVAFSFAELSMWSVLAVCGLSAALFVAWLTLRYIPHHMVGVVEKIWSPTGSVSE